MLIVICLSLPPNQLESSYNQMIIYYRDISHWCVTKYVSAFVCGNYNLYIDRVTLKTNKVGSICDVVSLLDFLMQRIVSIEKGTLLIIIIFYTIYYVYFFDIK